jgi:hypothetical protein
MKKLLPGVLVAFSFFTWCSNSSTGTHVDKTTYWKVVSRNTTTYTMKNGGFTYALPTAIPLDSVYLSIQGNDITLYIAEGSGAYSTSVTSVTFTNGPYFTINNSVVVDTSFASGHSKYVSFSGLIESYSTKNIDFLFHITDTTGDMGIITVESIDQQIPPAGWNLSGKDLFVDWKTFFGL